MFGPIGVTEIAVIVGVGILIFGPRQLPKIGRALGETIKELRGVRKELEMGDDHDR